MCEKEKLKSFLEKIVQNTKWHTRWLNTLAFMEHIGCRKIVKSQNSTHLSLTLLQHISEEARHAFYFKNLAHKLSPTDCPSFEEQYLIKGKESEDYFQAIDHKAEEDLIHSPSKNILNYLYTTWMIEERAVLIYKLYNEVLTRYAGGKAPRLHSNDRDPTKQTRYAGGKAPRLHSNDRDPTKQTRYAGGKAPRLHSNDRDPTKQTRYAGGKAPRLHSNDRDPTKQTRYAEKKTPRFNLNFILQEEDHHLKTTIQIIRQKDPEFKERKKRLFAYEKNQFAELVKKWQSALELNF